MVEVTRSRFEVLVGDALDALPEELASLIDNVVVVVEEESDDPDLLGYYEGVPLTERHDYGSMVMPDRIVIFRRPICVMCESEDDVVEEVLVTVVHELAHHFGIDDDRLDELGWS
jgi:predicted Zn-dependent protease with MMP-like domain